jgi:hypothetical protein
MGIFEIKLDALLTQDLLEKTPTKAENRLLAFRRRWSFLQRHKRKQHAKWEFMKLNLMCC